jgi:AcrR family transcriptional regulator
MATDRAPRAARRAVPHASARDRIVEAAYTLFCEHGIRAVGVDRIVAESGVAKMTLYRHFRSKDDLVLAFLDEREERWTRGWLQAESERRAANPSERIMALFDLLDEWFQEPGYVGCPIVNTLLEGHRHDPKVHGAAVQRLEVIRTLLQRYAEEAGAEDAEEASYRIQVLMMGAIVSAARGDREAARRARTMVQRVLDEGPQA